MAVFASEYSITDLGDSADEKKPSEVYWNSGFQTSSFQEVNHRQVVNRQSGGRRKCLAWRAEVSGRLIFFKSARQHALGFASVAISLHHLYSQFHIRYVFQSL